MYMSKVQRVKDYKSAFLRRVYSEQNYENQFYLSLKTNHYININIHYYKVFQIDKKFKVS